MIHQLAIDSRAYLVVEVDLMQSYPLKPSLSNVDLVVEVKVIER